VGFALGDLFLFQAFVIVGARISMLVYASVPIITGLAGFFFLHETLGLKDITGMMLTVTGIAVVVLDRNKGKGGPKNSHFLRGVFFAALGAAGQAGGLILSKFGMAGYNNPFESNMIRIMAGITGFTIIISVMRRWPMVKEAVHDKRGMLFTASGAFFGPFVGVSFALIAITLTSAGVASTIMSITPVLIIVPAILIYKEKVNVIEIAGAFLAVTGVALLFL
jgi:drug/metabolite transporter (DMT)-like permease